nr:unnamed protein product [Callosobruchus analis]
MCSETLFKASGLHPEKAVTLIDTPMLTKHLRSLEHRRKLAGLSLFFRFYYCRCSSRSPYTSDKSLATLLFFWRASTLWNELSGSLFPDRDNLQQFKSNVHSLCKKLSIKKPKLGDISPFAER